MPHDAALIHPDRPAMRLPQAWHMPLAVLAASIIALGLTTGESWRAMAHQWWNIDTYNHLLLIPAIIVWLVALKKDTLAGLSPRPFWPGLLAVVAALGVWRIGEVLGINLVAQAGAVGAVQAAVVCVLGVRVSLVLALPIAFAAFMVPFGDEIIPALQAVTAEIAIALTHASGIPAQIDGIYIDTPAGLFVVAEACSGVKFLIAMVTLGVLVCATRFERPGTRAAFMAACVVVPILANGVRAWATIYVAQYVGAERATGFDHIVYGWVFFAIVLGVLLGAAWRYVEREPDTYGWRVDAIARWPWVAKAEMLELTPRVAGVAIIAASGVAAATLLL
ncbi:exosortase A [Erythrobacter neustonensis]|uniref:Exosortase A n=1 Tax=Erythrobacter neustonensis TaxID=1112 RepID=A0A192D7C6_9SPHN|nr:exosortase A [Erythrobacter neustonensis]ANK13674.1 exosortase A [Erythrobacter neustonensis]